MHLFMANRLATTVYLAAALACTPFGLETGERGTSNRDRGGELLVSAAISLSGALERIASNYEHTSGTRTVLNVAGSDTLATQIVEGAPVDLFLSADDTQLDRVEARGLLVGGTRVDLLTNQLVTIVSTEWGGTVVEPCDLKSASIRHIAIGDPNGVPAGVYAKAYLDSIGLWESVADKIVPTRDVSAVLAAVEAGNADAGFVYRTDVLLSAGVHLAFEIPLDEGPNIRYSAAVITEAPSLIAARHFLEYLQSPNAQSIFEQAGFVVMDFSEDF